MSERIRKLNYPYSNVDTKQSHCLSFRLLNCRTKWWVVFQTQWQCIKLNIVCMWTLIDAKYSQPPLFNLDGRVHSSTARVGSFAVEMRSTTSTTALQPSVKKKLISSDKTFWVGVQRYNCRQLQRLPASAVFRSAGNWIRSFEHSWRFRLERHLLILVQLFLSREMVSFSCQLSHFVMLCSDLAVAKATSESFAIHRPTGKSSLLQQLLNIPICKGLG